MHIEIEHYEGKFPSFNVLISSARGKEAFLTIKGCRIIEGGKGRFISWPARKLDSGKYWNHVYASEAFNLAVIQAAEESKPHPKQQSVDDDIPFN